MGTKSENILLDNYMRDRVKLLFIFFLVIQFKFIKFINEINIDANLSKILALQTTATFPPLSTSSTSMFIGLNIFQVEG